ncbi:armadillo-type protein [Mycena filopes]|nr:armadillo-type protein [Mycena filopes]
MAAARRPPSPSSILSWWSDRNPLGATMSIHTFAKPLMRFMYHNQALGMIEKDIDPTVSPQKLDVLVTYLDFKHVSDSTKLYILRYLGERSWASQNEAQILVNGHLLPRLVVFFNSPNLKLSAAALLIFRHLTQHPSLRTAVLESDPCPSLVALALRLTISPGPSTDLMERVEYLALCSLAEISAASEDGARAVLEAGVMPLLQTTLWSPRFAVCGVSLWMVGKITRHNSLRYRLPVESMLPRLIPLLCVSPPGGWSSHQVPPEDLPVEALNKLKAAFIAEDRAAFLQRAVFVQRAAISALADITGASAEGGENVLSADVLPYVPDLLASKDIGVLSYTCIMLGHLAEHESLRPIMLFNNGGDVCRLLHALCK